MAVLVQQILTTILGLIKLAILAGVAKLVDEAGDDDDDDDDVVVRDVIFLSVLILSVALFDDSISDRAGLTPLLVELC